MKKPRFPRLRKFLVDLFTGPDGETWHIGRFYSLPMLGVGLAAPILALLKGHNISLSEMGVGMTALAGALTILIAGTNRVDNAPPEPQPKPPATP